MDISIVGKNSIKLKGKKVSFVVDPSKEMPKTSADAVILLNGTENVDLDRAADSRIVINGPGEYEIGGAKVSGAATPKGVLYHVSIDDVHIIVGKPTESKIEGFVASQVAVIHVDSKINESFITSLEPKITVLYGEKKEEEAKALGAQTITSVSKITVAKDKLPEKMEVVVLG